MLRFCANLSMLFCEYPLLQRFQLAKQQGFNAVEIQFPYELPVEQIQKALLENDLSLVLFNVAADTLLQGGEGLAAVPEKRAEFYVAVELALEYARLLKPLAINVLPGRCLDSDRIDAYQATLQANLAYAASAFADLGVVTLFEAINSFDMPGFIVNNSRQMLDVLAQVNHPNLRLQYDIYHMSRMGEDCSAFLRQHLDKVGHIQFADHPGRGQPGSGGIDFTALFGQLAASGYQGWLGAEYRPAAATQDSFAWLKSWPVSLDSSV